MRRILFVDDEPRVLQGLARTMRNLRDVWQMDYVDSGEKALALFDQSPYDAIVSDMRMPVMTGAELLRKVCDLYPQTLRVILSGQSDKQAILKSLECTHRYHAKPCDAESIVQVLNDAFETLFSGATILRAKLTGLRNLPYRMDTGTHIKNLCSTESPAPADLTKIVAQDVALSIRLLQLANSSFFGPPGTVADISSAVMLLGADGVSQVNEIVQQRQLEDGSCTPPTQDFAQNIGEHSYKVALAAARIARAENCSDASVGEAFTAGILHDAGRLALMACEPTSYEQMLIECKGTGWDIEQVERHLFGFDHGDAGRYLLSLLGISKSVVDAATFHHRPRELNASEFSAAAAVHVADSTLRGITNFIDCANDHSIDVDYLEHIGCADRLSLWQQKTIEELPV